MFWRRRERETPREQTRASGPLAEPQETSTSGPPTQAIELERDAPRAASITRVAEELRRRGEEVVELFKEISSPAGQAVLPIYLRRDGEKIFVEVETGPWEGRTVEGVLRIAAVLRSSEHSDAALEVLGAYPVPEEVSYFCGRSPAALFQLDLVPYDDLENPGACAESFRSAAERHWDLNLDYDPGELPLVEELLLAAFEDAESGARAPVLDALVHGLGCYIGETVRRHAAPQGSWRPAQGWGEGVVLEFPGLDADPIGEARAFLESGTEDSVAYYVTYALEELNGQREPNS
jgi:hypothetical protein